MIISYLSPLEEETFCKRIIIIYYTEIKYCHLCLSTRNTNRLALQSLLLKRSYYLRLISVKIGVPLLIWDNSLLRTLENFTIVGSIEAALQNPI
jgi:hypothetical protein